MMQKEGKNRKPLVLIISLVAAIVVLGAVLGILLGHFAGKDNNEVPEGGYLLYWNLEYGQAHSADQSGSYSFKLAYRGKPVTRKTTSADVAKEMDSLEIMGLVIENGLVTGVRKVEDFTGGYACGGSKVYVVSVDKNVITVSTDASGEQTTELTMSEDAVAYDVSGQSSPVGAITTLRDEDQILAILDNEGLVSQIFVAVRKDLGNTRIRYCDHCKQEVKWTMWEKITVLPAADSGHYYLNGDIQSKAQTSLQADTEIILDLNGYTIYGKEDNRIFSLHNQGAYLAIMDYSEKQTGTLKAGKSMMLIHQGACVWVRFGVFELYGGTLDGSDVYCVNNGATVSVPRNSVFNMYGGKITGGTIATTYEKDTEKLKGGMGGNVYVDGIFNMYGGTIEKGKAESYYFRDSNSYTNGLGGNVYVAHYGTFNMTGGELKNGSAHGGGANVFVNSGATFNMSGEAKITGGATTKPGKNGGSVYIPANATFNMDGGTITGGKTTNRGGNMVIYGKFNMTAGSITDGYCVDADGNEYLADWSNIFVVNAQNVNISGGYIKGHMYLMEANDRTYNVNISGTAQIKDAEEGFANLFIRPGNPINVGKMEKGAEVYVTATGNFSTATDKANKSYFHVDYKGVPVSYYEKCLFAGRLNCLCGTTNGKHFGECDGTLLGWGAWTKTDSLPTTTGNYYLVNDIDLRGQMSVTNEATIAVDLNGKTVTGKDNQRIYSLHSVEFPVSITLTDSSKNQTGKCIAVSTEPTVNEGLLYWLRYCKENPHTLTIYGGTHDASGVVNYKNGAAIHGTAGSTINIYGGTIIGGTAESRWGDGENAGFSGGRGGNIYTTGIFNMSGGTLTGGKTVAGTHAGATGDAYGGNLVLAGSTAVGKITGGTIENGSAILGGNLYIGNTATLEMTGMVIKDGVAERSGGNVYMGQQSVIVMNGGQILGGKNTTEGSNGGSIYICGSFEHGNATFAMTDGLVSGGKSMNMGGNFDVRGTLLIAGGEVKDGLSKNGDDMHSSAAVHSNIAVVNLDSDANNGVLYMEGGHVYGGVNSQTEVGMIFTNVAVVGDAKITAPEGYRGLNLRADGFVTVLGALTENAEIWVEKGVGSLVGVSGSEAPLTEIDAAAFKHSMCVAALEDGKVYMRATVANVSTAQELKDALEAGRDVKLAANITYDLSDCITLASGTTVNLDLNGYTINHTNTDRLVNLLAGSSSTIGPSSLTITDSSTAGTGAIISAGTGMFRVNTQATYGDAKLYINGGTYSCRTVFWAKATEVTGGTFSQDPTAYVPTGYKVTTSTDGDDKTWYIVEVDDTPPVTEPVEVDSAAELKTYMEAGYDVKLVANIAYDLSDILTLSSGTTVELDLNGYTITHTVTDRFVNLYAGSSTKTPSSLTIKDSSAAGTGAIISTGTGMFRVNTQATYGDAVLNIEGGTFSCAGGQNVFWAKATEVTGGTFTEDPTAFVPTGYRVTTSTEGGKTLYTVSQGEVLVTTAEQLKSDLEAGKNVKLGANIDYNLDVCITLAAGTTVELDLNGYTITQTCPSSNVNRLFNLYAGSSSAAPSSLTIIDSSASGAGAITSDGTGMFRVNTNATYGDAELYITGGALDCRTVFWAKATEVTGGSFTHDPTAYVPAGYEVTTSTVGGKTWYTVTEADSGITTAEALKAALEAGESVVLGGDITFENTDAASVFINMTVDTDVTLDLNGYKLTFNVTNTNHTIQLNGSNLIIDDTSAEKDGVMEFVYGGTGGHIFRVNGADAMTVNAGTIRYVPAEGVTAGSSASRNIIHSNGTVTINGGTIVNNVGGQTVNGYAGTINLNGGKFNVIPANSGTCVLVLAADHTLVKPDGSDFYEVVVNEADDFTEVTTEAALRAALESDEAKVRLGSDIEMSNTTMVSVTGEVVLDLNGYTLTIRSVNNNVHMIQLSSTSKMTVTDSSAAGTGTIRGLVVTNGISSHIFRVNGTDELVLEKCNLVYDFDTGVTGSNANYRNLIHSNGKVTVEDAVLDNNVLGETMRVWGSQDVTINGGKFSRVPVFNGDYTGTYTIKAGYTLADGDGDGMYELVANSGI